MDSVINTLKAFFGNYLLMSAAVAWLSAQIIKVFTGMFKERKFDILVLLFSNGGMPSSHSSAVCALMTSSAICYGAGSFQFAVTAILSIIVMMDASGVRYETGEQAKIINKITKELFSGRAEEINTGLKELVGHTPFQVLVGALLGVVVSILMSFAML